MSKLRGKPFRMGGAGVASRGGGFASAAMKSASASVEQATATAAALAEAEVLRAAAAAPPDEQTIASTTQLSGHVLPIAAALWNEERQHILSCDAETLRLWTTTREVRCLHTPCGERAAARGARASTLGAGAARAERRAAPGSPAASGLRPRGRSALHCLSRTAAPRRSTLSNPRPTHTRSCVVSRCHASSSARA